LSIKSQTELVIVAHCTALNYRHDLGYLSDTLSVSWPKIDRVTSKVIKKIDYLA